jgi:hypothetical protein
LGRRAALPLSESGQAPPPQSTTILDKHIEVERSSGAYSASVADDERFFVYARLSDEGVLRDVKIFTKVELEGQTYRVRGLTGAGALDDMFAHFGDRIRAVETHPTHDNASQFNAAIARGLDMTAAAESTWTGRQLTRRGFHAASVDAERMLEDAANPVYWKIKISWVRNKDTTGNGPVSDGEHLFSATDQKGVLDPDGGTVESSSAGDPDLADVAEAGLSSMSGKFRSLTTTISEADAQTLHALMASDSTVTFKYLKDGCDARAEIMVHNLLERGVMPSKVWLFPPEGEHLEFQVSHGRRQTIRWKFHVAVAIVVRMTDGRVQKMVIDPSFYDRPVPVEEWASLGRGRARLVETRLGESPWTEGGNGYNPYLSLGDMDPLTRARQEMAMYKQMEGG